MYQSLICIIEFNVEEIWDAERTAQFLTWMVLIKAFPSSDAGSVLESWKFVEISHNLASVEAAYLCAVPFEELPPLSTQLPSDAFQLVLVPLFNNHPFFLIFLGEELHSRCVMILRGFHGEQTQRSVVCHKNCLPSHFLYSSSSLAVALAKERLLVSIDIVVERRKGLSTNFFSYFFGV